jgi:hypothetical protein
MGSNERDKKRIAEQRLPKAKRARLRADMRAGKLEPTVVLPAPQWPTMGRDRVAEHEVFPIPMGE